MDVDITTVAIEVGKQVPALVVLVWIVSKFLRHLTNQSDVAQTREQVLSTMLTTATTGFREASETMSRNFADSAQGCHAVQHETVQAIAKNSAVLKQVVRTLGRIERRLEQLTTQTPGSSP